MAVVLYFQTTIKILTNSYVIAVIAGKQVILKSLL